jgi:signal transduction histidine kinase
VRSATWLDEHPFATPARSCRARFVKTLFDGPGEMRALCRSFDWASTSLGPSEEWPASLRVTVKNLLASRHPKFLFWGPELIQIFNDAYRPSLGDDGRHVLALGARGREFWTEIWSAIGPQIDQVLRGDGATWHEDQLLPIFRNGRMEDVYWTYSYSAAHDDENRIAGVLVVCQETTSQVTLRRQANLERSRLAYAFQQAPSFVAIVRGPPYVFEFVNEAYTRLVGQTDLVGRLVFDVVSEAREQGFEALLDEVVRTGTPFVGREVPLRLSRGVGQSLEERYLDFVYSPLIALDGSRSGVIVHGVDITDHVEVRREVERLLLASESARREADRARAEADAANGAKSEFLAMISHELRTPLAAIGGYVELLGMQEMGPLTATQSRFLERIQHNQRHVLGLIDDLLLHAQLESGQVQFRSEAIPIHELLDSCEALTMPQMHARDLQFTRSEAAPHLVAWADRQKTNQILANLVGNAIKFTEPGGRIAIDARQAASGAIHITVSDTGRGIHARDLSRVFEPFVQLLPPDGGGSGGAGLGLAISRAFARGMGGDLTATSSVGEGSAFCLVLQATASTSAS